MTKTLLITGATDGIGLATARLLADAGHRLLLHGRNRAKLDAVVKSLIQRPQAGQIEYFQADLSSLADTLGLARALSDRYNQIDVLINNAGVFRTPEPRTADGLDVRFAVNTIAPYLLSRILIERMGPQGRVINLSSAAQATVDLEALAGRIQLHDDFSAYAQSKLAITSWSWRLSQTLASRGPSIIAVNPGSMLGSKMVKQGFGVPGGDLQVGAKILVRAALSEEFGNASGRYFDNDSGRFAKPHADTCNSQKSAAIIDAIEAILAERLNGWMPPLIG